MGGHLRGRALRHDLTAVHACARTQIDHVVRLPDRLFVMLHHDHRVAEIAQIDQRVEQTLIVALMQADRGLIEDVHDADQTGADLAREADALRLAARQGVGAAVEGEISQADVGEKSETVADFLDDLHGDLAAPAGQLQLREELDGAVHGQRRHLGRALAVDEHVPGGAVEPRSPAFGTGARGSVLGQLFAHRDRFGFLVAALEVPDDAFEGMSALDRAAFAVEIFELDLLILAAEQHEILDLLRQALERRFDVEFRVPRERLDQLKIVGIAPVPAAHRAAGERQMRVGDHFLGVEKLLGAEPVAARAGADRAVEREQARLELGQRIIADRAGEFVGEHELRALRVIHVGDPRHPCPEPQRGFERLGETLTEVRHAL